LVQLEWHEWPLLAQAAAACKRDRRWARRSTGPGALGTCGRGAGAIRTGGSVRSGLRWMPRFSIRRPTGRSAFSTSAAVRAARASVWPDAVRTRSSSAATSHRRWSRLRGGGRNAPRNSASLSRMPKPPPGLGIPSIWSSRATAW